MWEIIKGVRTLHAKAIVSRDLADRNIILRKSNGKPVLIDFGAGLCIKMNFKSGSKITAVGDIAHLVSFPPELQLIESHKFEYTQDNIAAYDIWKLGILFYKLAVFQIEDYKISKGDFSSLGGFSGPLRNLIQDMLNQNPEKRISIHDI